MKQCTVFVAETENGEVIGFADCGNERSGDYPGIEGEVYAIYILEAYQGQNIGKLKKVIQARRRQKRLKFKSD